MTKPKNERDPQDLGCGPASRTWAYDLGSEMRSVYGPLAKRWDSICPFRTGTQHRHWFMSGWKGGPRP